MLQDTAKWQLEEFPLDHEQQPERSRRKFQLQFWQIQNLYKILELRDKNLLHIAFAKIKNMAIICTQNRNVKTSTSRPSTNRMLCRSTGKSLLTLWRQEL